MIGWTVLLHLGRSGPTPSGMLTASGYWQFGYESGEQGGSENVIRICAVYMYLEVIDLRGSLIRRIRTSNPFPACRCVPAKLRCRDSKATSSTPRTDFLVSIQCSPFVSSSLPLPASNPPQPRVFCRTPQVPGESAAVQLLLTRIPCQWNAHPMA